MLIFLDLSDEKSIEPMVSSGTAKPFSFTY